ncbi:hypothetical protein Tco_0196732 [Tanacetum coccineum]
MVAFFMMEDPKTKMDIETQYEKLKDNEKKQLGKNNEAKMTLYNALPHKKYERVFMCKIVNEISNTLIITHQGNSEVMDCRIDLLTQQYEKSLALKANVTREQTSDDSDSQEESDEDVDEDEAEAFNLMERNFQKIFRKGNNLGMELDSVAGLIDLEEAAKIVLEIKAVEAQDNSENAIIIRKKVTSLSSVQSPRKTRLLLEELGVIVKMVMNLKMT